MYGVPQVLLGGGEDREAGEHQDRHLGLENGLVEWQQYLVQTWPITWATLKHPTTTLLSSATDYQETEEDKWEKLNQGHLEMLVGISNNNQL